MKPLRLTLQQYILQQQQQYPQATGEFSWMLSGITLATKQIQAAVRRAGLNDILGEAGSDNVQGEQQQVLDVYANNALIQCMSVRDNVAMLVSEENDRPIYLPSRHGATRYAVVFDPLDGSSNIDVNVSVGTIFSILRLPADFQLPSEGNDADLLLPGSQQVAAGYVAYGSSTVLVYTSGNGVHMFTLDPEIGAYVISREDVRMPDSGNYYSVNEARLRDCPSIYQDYVRRLGEGFEGREYGSRYIGSMVADVHRTLLKGGVFLYPETAKNPSGKLRMLYEVNPIAMLVEQAGGVAMAGARRVLDIVPESIHQRSALVLGSKAEMALYREMVGT